MNILLTSAGRRVSLLRAFRRAVQNLKGSKIIAADCDPTAPTLIEADESFILPRVSSDKYIEELINLCERKKIDLVIPLIDPELPLLAGSKGIFYKIGCTVAISAPETVNIGNDKLATWDFFTSNNIPAAQTFTKEEVQEKLKRTDLSLPVIIKPRWGSSSQGIIKCDTIDQLSFYISREKDIIIQEMLLGPEVTLDIMGDGQGGLLALVPRKRLKIRGGEVERGITVDDGLFYDYVVKIVQILKPFGAINIQCFITGRGPVFTEINPRFGGGYPLADAAGAQFPEMLIALARGEKVKPRIGQYKRGLLMTRFDEAFFISLENDPLGNSLMKL
ncbi:hypothetical protein MTAT_18590 [Moorella thermoacetica]|uniref:Carbamoyl-phosphate synthase large chain n=1 Tax=Neomoorella thermoacetica TaxID=1525 RepID=A0AAC9MU36_NEOTH|nr:ATP-grasp domain-containing protein [Moorella thermoacetica]AOQ23325.1 Carbamoyl-phosphate synthase large chain [Moorella thermoacetica]TYL13033.1 hypothetical protein MTAT_18590 [Moorella thermoacetica]